jgi:adenosylcobinamide-GDP ribazoletransferase
VSQTAGPRDAAPDARPRLVGSEWPGSADFRGAVAFLTILRSRSAKAPTLGRGTLFFPLLGLGLGVALWLVDRSIGALLPALPRAMLILLVWQAATGARSAQGLLHAGAGLRSGADREKAVRAIEAGSVKLTGLLVVLTVLVLEVWALVQLERTRLPALLFAPLLAAWSMVVLSHGARAARIDGRQGKFAPEVSFRDFALTSVFSFGVLFSLARAGGIALGVVAGAVIVSLRVMLHWWLGGVNAATVAATSEIVLATILLLFAGFEPA